MFGAESRTAGAGIASIVALAMVLPLPASATTTTTDYYWRWSDGSRADARTFGDPGDSPRPLPRLVVTGRPAVAGIRVQLQFRDDGRWVTEDVSATDRRGVARLELNPYCADGGWCRTTFDYRLTVDGQAAGLRVTYAT